MKFDRQQNWNKRIQRGHETSFKEGFNAVMNMWDISKLGSFKFTLDPYGKGMQAGVKKRKEMDMEALLLGTDPKAHLYFRETEWEFHSEYIVWTDAHERVTFRITQNDITKIDVET